jgi:hypothetical protein
VSTLLDALAELAVGAARTASPRPQLRFEPAAPADEQALGEIHVEREVDAQPPRTARPTPRRAEPAAPADAALTPAELRPAAHEPPPAELPAAPPAGLPARTRPLPGTAPETDEAPREERSPEAGPALREPPAQVVERVERVVERIVERSEPSPETPAAAQVESTAPPEALAAPAAASAAPPEPAVTERGAAPAELPESAPVVIERVVTAAPPPPPIVAPAPAPEPAPVHVSIGRVEIRAHPPEAPRAAPGRSDSTFVAGPDLGEYLDSLDGGRR